MNVISIFFQFLNYPLMERCHLPDGFFQLLVYLPDSQHLAPVLWQENKVIKNRVPGVSGCPVSHTLILHPTCFPATPSAETGGNSLKRLYFTAPNSCQQRPKNSAIDPKKAFDKIGIRPCQLDKSYNM